jgi:hypothetical protein
LFLVETGSFVFLSFRIFKPSSKPPIFHK